jgi:L-2-hydroxycarboxylate dehydrogenase (NAD+)
MLERFHVPADEEIRVSDDALRRTVADIFQAVGVPASAAVEGADVLVTTDLRGVETHGVSNMLRIYVNWFRSGRLNPTPEWRVIRDRPGIAVIDGDAGLGILQGRQAMELAIEKARSVGSGVVTMRNSGHLGAVGHFATLAARENMVGVCMTAMSVLVLPTYGALPRLGTNPISIAAPAGSQPFLLFDAATSAIAGNKIRLAERLGVDMEPGWVAGLDGAPIVDRRPVPPDGAFYQLPLGGTREQGSHKGYGFALMGEVLCTLLSGSVPSMLDPDVGSRHYFSAYDIEAFSDIETFKQTMDRMLLTLRETPPAPGEERVIYPGLPEFEAERERRERGIPLHVEVIDWFDSITDELGIPPLERA